jgi:hypothetical protein
MRKLPVALLIGSLPFAAKRFLIQTYSISFNTGNARSGSQIAREYRANRSQPNWIRPRTQF